MIEKYLEPRKFFKNKTKVSLKEKYKKFEQLKENWEKFFKTLKHFLKISKALRNVRIWVNFAEALSNFRK